MEIFGARRRFATMLCVLYAAGCLFSVTESADSASSDLDEAAHMILSHSSQLDTDHISHIQSLDEREGLTNAIHKVLESYKDIAESTDLATLKYRRMDGLGNNLKNILAGASLHTEIRILENAYDDKTSIPRHKAKSGNLLPSARDVSLACFLPDSEDEDDGFLDKYISQLFMQYGQFLDHDLIFTEMEIGSECCKDMMDDGTHPDMFNNGPCFPLHVPANDRFFNVSCLSNRRSLGELKSNVREQINGVTSFVDASQVYGPSDILSAELRQFTDGLLKVEPGVKYDFPLLPNLDMYKCLKDSMPKCPHAGDPRVNVFPGLTIMHLLFHREHNRVAAELKKVNPMWDDERLFQEARKIVIATTQKITYDEYVPKILGPEVMDIIGLNDPYAYDESIDPSISNVFGAAAFRFGHSQINGLLKVSSEEIYEASETFFRPGIGVDQEEGVIKNIVINQAKQKCQKTDQFFSHQVTDKLFFGVDAPGESLDLPALAVQRCRDHGLPPYIKYVDLCIGDLAKKASGGEHDCPVTTLNLPTCFADGIYESVEDIDLFTGAMYETHVSGGIVGPTFAYLIGEQFYRLKFGDRFFYETTDQTIGFTPEQLQEIQNNTGLANLICHNSIVAEIHPRPLETRRYQDKQSCELYTDINFDLWKED